MFVKVMTLAIAGTLLSLILKKHCRELIPFFEIAVVIAAIFLLFGKGGEGGRAFEKIFSLFKGDSEIFSALFKGAAVTVLTKFACDVCRESGNGLMGDVVELGGRIMLIILVLPFIEKVLEIALSFV